MTLDQFAERALDVPFVEFGRDWDGWDCWGVLYMAFKETMGIELPVYTGQYESTKEKLRELQDLIMDSKRAQWIKVGYPQTMDGVLLRLRGQFCHIGLMLDRRTMLHCEEKRGTMIERIDRMPWNNRVEGFYRHAAFH